MKERKRIDPEMLLFEPFKTDFSKTIEFDCGNESLNEFLCSEEVRRYEEELLGRTYLAFYQGSLVAYYTISAGSLRKETVDLTCRKNPYLNIEEIPSTIIGRLAVDKEYQGSGIGSYIVKKIIVESILKKDLISRLVLVQAKKEAFDFYRTIGFEFVKETRREKNRYRTRGTRTMFFDLKYLRDRYFGK